MSSVKMPVSALELQEYLFAANLPNADKQLIANARSCFYYHRFQVMNWLMMNGVSIPSQILSDQTHPIVGTQSVDAENGTVKSVFFKPEEEK